MIVDLSMLGQVALRSARVVSRSAIASLERTPMPDLVANEHDVDALARVGADIFQPRIELWACGQWASVAVTHRNVNGRAEEQIAPDGKTFRPSDQTPR